MDESVLILVGTQTGNAERVAEAVEQRLADAGRDVRLVDLYDAVPEMLAETHWLLVVTSTWKEGRLPDNAIDFFGMLETLAPDGAHLAYGVIGLGDRRYEPHYQHAARTFEHALDALGARRLMPTFEIDGGPSVSQIEAACAWAEAALVTASAQSGGE